MNIVIGTNNIANILTGVHAGFKSLGHSPITILKEKSRYYDDSNFECVYRKWDQKKFKINFSNRLKEKIDYSQQAKKLRKRLLDSMPTTDLYVLCWSSFHNDFSDYALLKKHNKKIITLFAGSEVRYAKAFSHEFKMNIDAWDESLKNDNLNEKLFFVRTAELYSDLVLSVPDQSGLMLLPYNHFFLPIDLSKYSFKNTQREIPVIVHAPTRTGAKGTEVFKSVIERLTSEGVKFEFKLVQNLTNIELINLLSNSDILLDELYFHGPGMMAAEAMALGCVVATRKLNNNKIFDPPVCDINFDSVYEKVKQLILDHQARLKLAKDARAYVENHNECGKVCNRMLEALNNSQRDYTPAYYAGSFNLPQDTIITEQNKVLTRKLMQAKGMDVLQGALKAKNLI